MSFGEILSNLMRDKNITAYRLSKDTGISQSVIGKWKTGEKEPKGASLTKLSEYLQVTTDFLLGKEQKEKPTDLASELRGAILNGVNQINSEDVLQEILNYCELQAAARRNEVNR